MDREERYQVRIYFLATVIIVLTFTFWAMLGLGVVEASPLISTVNGTVSAAFVLVIQFFFRKAKKNNTGGS